MAKSDLRIDILGTSITISADEDRDYLTALLEKYRRTIENVQRVSGLGDPLKTAVLTGFLLCDDLEKAGSAAPEKPAEASGDESGEAEKLTLAMISRLDQALNARKAAAPRPEEFPAPVVPAASNAPARKNSAAVYKLQNTVKNYAWGSPEWIPALLGQRNPSRVPWAELWMGVNPAGPSRLLSAGNAAPPPLLSELIADKRDFSPGREGAEQRGNLPFLFKLIAAAKPLSIQVHPNREQAREGFERENSRGTPNDAQNRNYRDSNHKPEILCALNPMTTLCGFRDEKTISELFTILSQNCEGRLKAGFESLVSALAEENPLKAFLASLFSLESEVREAAASFIKQREALLERDFPEYRDEWKLCSYLAGFYPGDPGILAPLYLNIVELAPGEAVYLPAGVFHTYIYGLGIELMADSDNVLRGGLTPKHIDREELVRVLNFSAFRPEILKIPEAAPSWFSYPSPREEFSLSVMRARESSVPFGGQGASIVIVTEGSAAVTAEQESSAETLLAKGESVFIPAGEKPVFSGTFTAYAASACESL